MTSASHGLRAAILLLSILQGTSQPHTQDDLAPHVTNAEVGGPAFINNRRKLTSLRGGNPLQ